MSPVRSPSPRVSAIRDPRDGSMYGLTYRVGRHVAGAARVLADVLCDLAGRARAGRGGGEEGKGGGGGTLPPNTHPRELAG